MIRKISNSITTWLIKKEAINFDDFEIYDYAIQIMIYLFIPYLLITIMIPITGLSYEGFLIITSYTLLRRECGGFHFNSEKICLLISSLLLYVIQIIGKCVSENFLFTLISIASSLSIIFFSPLGKDKENDNSIVHKKIKILIIIAAIFLINYLFNSIFILFQTKWLNLGIILTAILQYPRILSKTH